MKSYKEFSKRYILANKGRSISIIIGIIISVSLITGIFSIVDTIRAGMLKEYTTNNFTHVNMFNVKGNKAKDISKDIRYDKVSISTNLGTSEEQFTGKYSVQTKLYMEKVNKEYLENHYKSVVKDGVLPNYEGEMLVDENFLKEQNKKIGDTITIQYRLPSKYNKEGDLIEEVLTVEEITGKITGTVSNEQLVILSNFSEFQENEDYYVGIAYKDPNHAPESIKEIEEKLKNDKDAQIMVNEELLMLQGVKLDNGYSDLITMAKRVLIFLVIISSIGLIYNTFMISVSERIKEFGLLRAVGMSKRQIRKILTREACIIGAIGITLGVIAGVGGIFCLTKVVNLINVKGLELFEFSVSKVSIISSIIISVITIGVSIFIPLRKASKASPVAAIRNNVITNEKIKVSKRKGILSKVFGSSAELAYKNLRRNKTRFRVIVLGLALSIFIFTSFTSYMQITEKAMTVQSTISAERMKIYTNNTTNFKEIEKIQGIDYLITENIAVPDISKDTSKSIVGYKIKGDNIFTEKYLGLKGNNEKAMPSIVNVEDKVLRNLKLESGKYDKEQFEKRGIILQNKGLVLKEKGKELIDITNIKVGDKIDLVIEYSSGESEETKEFLLKDITVAGIMEEPIVCTIDMVEQQKIYINDKLFEELCDDLDNMKMVRGSEIVLTDEEKSEEVYEELNNNLQKYNIDGVYSTSEDAKQWAKMMLVFKIAVYGFLILVSAITMTNIIASVSANIHGRRKEVSLLRAVGTSSRYIQKMIYVENLYYGFYSIGIGSILGIGSSIMINKVFVGMYEGIYVLPIIPIIISSVILITFLFIISRILIKKICGNNIIEEIREE